MQVRKILYLALLIAVVSAEAMAQSDNKPVDAQRAHEDSRSIEDLNMKGGDAAMPPFSDSIIDVNSGYRQEFFNYGLAIRDISLALYGQNLLNAPVPVDDQVYVGERPFQNVMTNPILTWDPHRTMGIFRPRNSKPSPTTS